MIVLSEPLYSHQIILAAYTSSRSYGYSSSRSYSSGSYSSSRVSTPSRSYTSTRTPSGSSKSYTSTRSSSSSKSGYTSTRGTTPITKSNIYSRTTPAQRTTVINNYHSDMYGFNSFFHPFGWGYGGGNFWMWMYLFDHNQYQQNQQIVQASNVAVQPQDNFWQDTVFVVLAVVLIGGCSWGIWLLIRHLRWM